MYDYTQNPLYNPTMNPYLPQAHSQLAQPRQEVVKVNGENGARAFPIGANSSALLLDESGALVWLVTTDGAGYKTVSPFDIAPHQTAQPPDFNSLEERITKLEEMMQSVTARNPAATQRSEQKSADRQSQTDQAAHHKSEESA